MNNSDRHVPRRRLLLVDDDMEFVEDASLVLARDFECDGVSDPDAVLDACERLDPDVVLLDIDFHGEPLGFDILTQIRAVFPFLPVIVWTDDRSVEAGIEAQRRGAVHTVRKTPARNEVVPAVEFALRRSCADIHTSLLESELDRDWGAFVYGSPVTAEVLDIAARFAAEDDPVLITGDRGVGKGVLAREIHSRSGRSGARFVTVDCSGIPSDLAERELFGNLAGAYTGAQKAAPGLCDAAQGGTLFLDEIGDTTPELQAKLRRLSEERLFRPVGATRESHADIRLIAATNRDPEEDIRDGRFRADLFDRLSTLHVHVPPLRDRPDDIPVLAEYFLAERSGRTGKSYDLAPDAILYLESQDWPQNVRGLKNAIARACALSDDGVITAASFASSVPGSKREPMDLGPAMDRFERQHLVRALHMVGGNKTEAADLLGVSRGTIHRLINRHGISEDEWS